jgi:hypothetical protein
VHFAALDELVEVAQVDLHATTDADRGEGAAPDEVTHGPGGTAEVFGGIFDGEESLLCPLCGLHFNARGVVAFVAVPPYVPQ